MTSLSCSLSQNHPVYLHILFSRATSIMAASSSSIPFSEHVAPALSTIQGNPQSAIAVTALLLGGSLLWMQSSTGTKSAGFPRLVNQTAQKFQDNPQKILDEGRAQFKDKPFTIKTYEGDVTVLSPELGNALRNEPGLSFTHAAQDNLHAHLPGFSPFIAGNRNEALMQIITRKQLTKSLSRITGPLSVEASFAIEHNFGSSTAWRSVNPYTEYLDIVARLSSRIFLGEELCRNEEWLNITKLYTVISFQAAEEIRRYPMWMRRFANAWLVPKSRIVRQQLANATKLVDRVIEERKRQDREGKAASQRLPNAIDWCEEESADVPYDSGLIQVTLSTAAVHTTSDLLTETMLRLAQEPEFVQELRAEIKSSLEAEGAWTKTVLFKLKMVDSALKEAQRMRPIISASMVRRVMAPTPVPGTDRVLPKGAQTVVSTHPRFDPEIYEQPHKYIGRRFADMRTNGESKLPVHLVSTGQASLAFGHGAHACPGRFFAANELKVALCHLLIKYDWEVDPDQVSGSGAVDMSPRIDGFNLGVNTSLKLRFRKRTPEEMGIDLDAIDTGME
ncbi:cytochrome P450 monooxygenase 2 [Microdochium nivale]|nr:cytochrome P450 monooxygenase 2 [Microdochium nivale]